MKNRLAELVLLLMICLAPWAFGAVEAWAKLGLYAGIAVVTMLNFASRPPVGARDWPVGGAGSAGVSPGGAGSAGVSPAFRGRSGRDARAPGTDPRTKCRAPGNFGSNGGTSLRSRLGRLPSLALGGLVLLTIFQATPVGRDVRRWVSPSSALLSAQLSPTQPEVLVGDAGPVVALPSTTLSVDPDSTLQTAAQLAAAWLLFEGVLGLQGGPNRSVTLAKIVVFNCALLALFAIVQGFTWNGCIYWIRPANVSTSWSAGGPFLSHNHLAAYLNMGLGLALGLLLQGTWRDFLRRDSTKLWIAYAAGMIAVGVVTSHSRSGFLGLLAATIVLACFLRSRLIRLGFGLAVSLAVVGLMLAILAGSSSYGSRLATIFDLGDMGYLARFELWRGALQAWCARPIWGSGFGVFPVAVNPYLTRSHTVFFARAENEYVDLLVEGGAVGFLLALAFLAGVGGLAGRAIRRLPAGNERGLVVGAGFGLIALSVQSFGDFAPHIPAVGVLAVVLCALIIRLETAGGTNEDVVCESSHVTERSASFRAELAWMGSVVLSVALVVHAIRDARIENRLTEAGLPLPGAYMPTVGTMETVNWGLDEWRDALQDALRSRPNWAEGYTRLGLVHLGMYRRMAKEWLDDAEIDANDVERMAEPLWLLGAVHHGKDPSLDQPLQGMDVLTFEPVASHLVPAARCFLEARRCSPFMALPHAELASLNYLLTTKDSASAYTARALTLSGNQEQLLMFLAQIAVQTGDHTLAARSWRKALEVMPSSWTAVAEGAAMVFSPDEILSDVVAEGRHLILFADHLYGQMQDRATRDRFFQAALERLPVDRGLTQGERFFFEAHALAGLDHRAQARIQMEAALAMQPAQSAWREEYIAWLLRWGRADEAHAQALNGRYFSPDSEAIREAVDRTAEVLARGGGQP